ncbi:MAG TPA: ferredoxin [Pseudonocardia sp.]|nr:ferredoxin [Pseudonocardia sp.]
MKYLVDEALCSGHGLCAAVAPDVYSLDDEGFNAQAGRTCEVPAGLEAAAREGAESCPDVALVIVEE